MSQQPVVTQPRQGHHRLPNPRLFSSMRVSPPTQQSILQLKWMAASEEVAACPPGLECLSQLDQLNFARYVELQPIMIGLMGISEKKVLVKNTAGEVVYQIIEKKNQNCWYGSAPGFVRSVFNAANQEVMRVTPVPKDYAGCCWCACCDKCRFDVCIQAPIGQPFGYLRQLSSFTPFKMAAMDANRQPVMILAPASCCSGCASDDILRFDISTADGARKLGKCFKKSSVTSPRSKETAFDLEITFPMDLDIASKALLLGAANLMNVELRQHSERRNQRRR